MKKSTVVAVIALIVVSIYIFTIGNKFTVYNKEVFYKTPEEAISNFIGFINVQEKVKDKDGVYNNETPKEFLESISKRYRLYSKNGKMFRYINNTLPSLASYNIKELIEDDDTEFIRSIYTESFSDIKGYEKPKEIRFFTIESNEYSYAPINRENVNEDGTVRMNSDELNEQSYSIFIDLVVIDEGKGYVVDYYNAYN